MPMSLQILCALCMSVFSFFSYATKQTDYTIDGNNNWAFFLEKPETLTVSGANNTIVVCNQPHTTIKKILTSWTLLIVFATLFGKSESLCSCNLYMHNETFKNCVKFVLFSIPSDLTIQRLYKCCMLVGTFSCIQKSIFGCIPSYTKIYQNSL